MLLLFVVRRRIHMACVASMWAQWQVSLHVIRILMPAAEWFSFLSPPPFPRYSPSVPRLFTYVSSLHLSQQSYPYSQTETHSLRDTHLHRHCGTRHRKFKFSNLFRNHNKVNNKYNRPTSTCCLPGVYLLLFYHTLTDLWRHFNLVPAVLPWGCHCHNLSRWNNVCIGC